MVVGAGVGGDQVSRRRLLLTMRQRFSFRRFSLRRPGLFLGAVAMAALLGVLAVLQYRWVGQLSNDERDRMRAHLNRRADGFADDFNRELTRVFFRLQIGAEIPADGELATDESRFDRWYEAESRPDVVRAIYQVAIDDQGGTSLREFRRGPARFEPTAWPTALEPIRERFEQARANGETGGTFRFQPVWPAIPALVIPRVVAEGAPPSRMALSLVPAGGFTIALLDEGAFQREVIPMLIERHFGTDHEPSTVHVGVVGPRGLVYPAAGTSTPAALVSSPDAKHTLFELRPFEFNRFVERRHDKGADAEHARRGAGGPPRSGSRITTSLNILRDERGRTLLRTLPLGGQAPPSAAWQVTVLHRAGSLDAAVGRARGRNLVVSFGVLMLLGVSMAMVLVSTGRARRLAAQQMEFVAGVSHELRTPLAVIRSAAENLADGIVADPKQVKKYGDVIASEGRRLTQMVEQIMDFAGFESGRAHLDVRPAEVGAVIDEALRGAAPHLREHATEVEQQIPAALPLVLVDPNAVSRSLQNLIVNALKYGGTPPRVALTAATASGEVRLTVADNGVGIAAHDLPHIFEPFYRGTDATSRQIHGSGLGLSLVKRIMDEIGGRVTVTTDPAQGSAFTLHLPIAPEAHPAPTPDASPSPATLA